MRRLLNKFSYSRLPQVTILVDNKSAIALAENLIYYGRTKYIELRYYFIREKVTVIRYCEKVYYLYK